METDQLPGVIVYLDDDFGISYQDCQDHLNAHFRVNRWSPSIAKRCKIEIDRLFYAHKRDVVGISHPSDRKHHKLLRYLGFKWFRNKWIIKDNIERDVSVWIRRIT